ncbi:hypothetical protein BBJ28_00012294 [Nothophytophthora sp. Chile5]|nr:hypothetical protein BBJ28_00012294 [Nothophytophthora sp. Chile5]
MSFIERCDGIGAGRRRTAQLSKEEWRAALQQQIQDKEQQKAARRASGCEGGENQEARTGGVSAFTHTKLDEGTVEVAGHAEGNLVAEAVVSIPRMGRRGVQQLSKEQWREALEQQIREKNQSKGQQRDGNDEQLRRSYSAPQQEAKEEQLDFCPEREYQERAATTSSCDATSSQEVGYRGHSRRAVAPQSRELYLKSLQEQIEDKQVRGVRMRTRVLACRLRFGSLTLSHCVIYLMEKRLAQAEKEKDQQSRRHCRLQGDAAANQDERRLNEEWERGVTPPDARNVQQEAHRQRDESEDVANGRRSLSLSNQEDVGSHLSAPTASAAAADPVAIAKIVDFCEELKKQNEDVKKQLLEQHSVLTTGAQIVKGERVEGPEQHGPPIPHAEPKHGTSTRLETIPSGNKGSPAEALCMSASKVDQSRRDDALVACLKPPECGDEDGTPASTPESEAKDPAGGRGNPTFSKRRGLDVRNSCKDSAEGDAIARHASSDAEDLMQRDAVEKELGEKPLGGDSKLVRGWVSCTETGGGGDLLNCTSIPILDGSSSLIPLDRPLADLFQR